MNHDGLWVRKPLAGGGEYVDITRLTDGRVLCQLCYSYTPRRDLFVDEDGDVWDSCAPCSWRDAGNLPAGACPCECCVALLYWNQHGRDYTMHDTCTCITYLDRGFACECAPCVRFARREPPSAPDPVDKDDECPN